jgi:hypothetical protein
VELHAARIAELSGRPLSALTRRDVALALLAVAPDDALESLPGIRRALLAAENPLSAAFWESAESTLTTIGEGDATFPGLQSWLETTGTEPTGVIGLHVWDDPTERSPLQEEMHTRLVNHLEDQVTAGRIDPDGLVRGDPTARSAYLAIQQQWMTTPLPDGRVPMNVMLDEQDEQLFAEWAAADREALEALDQMLRKAGERRLPTEELATAAARLRSEVGGASADGRMLAAFAGMRAGRVPADDRELWLDLATGIVDPQGDPEEFTDMLEAHGPGSPVGLPESGSGSGDDLPEDDLSEDDDDYDYDADDPVTAAIAAVAALDHFDWLAVMSVLVAGGPGTPASASDLAGYVRHYDPDDAPDPEELTEPDDEDPDFDFDALDDELALEGLFTHILPLWQALGAINGQDQLTPLGWWGLPEALKRVWSASS